MAANVGSRNRRWLEAWSMIVRILAATGNAAGARSALADALAANPSSEALQALSGN